MKNSEKYPDLKIGQRVVIDNHFYCDKCDMCDEGACHMCPTFKHYGFGGGVDQGEVFKLMLQALILLAYRVGRFNCLKETSYQHQFETCQGGCSEFTCVPCRNVYPLKSRDSHLSEL